MEHPVTSTSLLAEAVSSFDRFARVQLREAVDPDAGTGQAYECGRRALAARSGAEEWIIPDAMAREVEELETAFQAAPSDEALEWLDRFPHTVLEVVDRRHRTERSPDAPRRRFAEITREVAVARAS